MQKKHVGLVSLLASAFVFGFYGILVRIIGFNLPLFYAAFVRNALGSFILLLILLGLKKKITVKKNDMKWLWLRAGAGMLGFLGAYIPIMYLTIGTFYFVSYAGITIGGYALGYILMKEKLTPLKIASLILALCGLFFIYSVNMDASKLFYLAFSFVGGVGTSGWTVFSKKISDSYPAAVLNFWDFVLAVVLNLCITLILKERWITPSPNAAWFATLGFVLMFIITGQLIIYGFKYLDAQIGTIILLLEIVFGILFAFLFFHESVSIMTIVGGIFILAAILIPQLMSENGRT